MLSPGKWHEQVPRGHEENLNFRAGLRATWRGRPDVQRTLLAVCQADILFWVNAFVWQFNPNTIGTASTEQGPFITWPFQDEAIGVVLDSIDRRKDVLFEKSREMGASWICLLVIDWLMLFHDRKQCLAISRNEHAVDRPDDPDSLFWKLDYIHQHLPDWMAGSVRKRRLGYRCGRTHSTITGQASTGKAGVGGRGTCMFIDEFSQINEDHEVLSRTSDTTGCRIFNGTHRGLATAFYELSRRADWRKLVMHWSLHPDKRRGLYRYDSQTNQVVVLDRDHQYPPDFAFVRSEAPTGGPFPGLRSPWYDEQCSRKSGPRQIAEDLDIDPGGSVSQFFSPLTIRTLASSYACPPYWEGDIAYDRDSGRPVALSAVAGGPLKLWLCLLPDGSVPRSRYAGGADIACGTGASNSCLSIADAVRGEKVAEYASPHKKPEEFALICTAILWLFRDVFDEPPLFAWEHAGPGVVFASRVKETGYGHIYNREAHQGLGGGKISNIPGWYPSNEQKRLLLESYRAALDSRQFTNRSEAALLECLAYRYTSQGTVEHPEDSHSQDPTGARVNHGDRVIADALAHKMVRALGVAGGPRKTEDTEVKVGTLAWRRQLAAQRATS